MDLLTASVYKQGIWAWSEIMAVVPFLKLGACYLVCQGNISIIASPWRPIALNFWPTIINLLDINLKLSDLWWPISKTWNETMVGSIFIEDDVDRVIELRVPQQGEDELLWILESSGQFSIKSTFHAKNIYYFNLKDVKIWQKLWNAKIHYRLMVTLRRFVWGVVPTKE